MFSVELKINGSMISHIYGKNVKDDGSGYYLYDYEYYQPETRGLKTGSLRHKRDAGLARLVRDILTDVIDE